MEGSMPALQAMSVRSSSVQLLYVEPDLDNVQPVMMVWQSDSDLPRPTSVLFRAHGPGVSFASESVQDLLELSEDECGT